VVLAIVTNTGERSGVETVQLYVPDLVGSVTRPARELKSFHPVLLDPGEATRVRFEVPVGSLGCRGPDMTYPVETGGFRVWVGSDSEKGLEGAFALGGT
jgi:beta-glucosidase